MPRIFWFMVPAAVVLAVGLAWVLTRQVTPPCEDFVDANLAKLSLEQGCVRVTAQAHYQVVIKQKIPGNLLEPDRELYLFPLFEEHQTDDRAIRLLVRTERPPDRLVSFESMTVSGRLLPVTYDEVPAGTEVQIGKRADYFFEDGMLLLVPDRVESDGEVWTRGE